MKHALAIRPTSPSRIHHVAEEAGTIRGPAVEMAKTNPMAVAAVRADVDRALFGALVVAAVEIVHDLWSLEHIGFPVRGEEIIALLLGVLFFITILDNPISEFHDLNLGSTRTTDKGWKHVTTRECLALLESAGVIDK